MSKVTVQNSNNPYCQRYSRQSGRGSRRRRKSARAHYQKHDSTIDAIGVGNNVDETDKNPPDEFVPTFTSLVEASNHSPPHNSLITVLQETSKSEDKIMERTTNEDTIEDTTDNSSKVAGITFDQGKKIVHDDFQKLMKSISSRSPQLDFESALSNAM